MEEKNYYIGLDVGTDSVGWAVTDEDYNLCKARGKELWGSYLFDEAQTAVERRTFRSQRRRLDRKELRIKLLQELFCSEIAKIDPTFFLRLKESKLFVEDKDEKIKTKNILFNDANFHDKNYFGKYQTIFHLRKALMTEEISDVRLLYLAIHHIIKNRGHFLFENQNFETGKTDDVVIKFEEINSILSEMEESTFSLENIDKVIETLKNDKIGKKDKQKQLCDYFNAKKNKMLSAGICALVGGTVKMSDLFPSIEEFNVEKFSFDTPDFNETVLPQMENDVGEDNVQIIVKLKAIYDWSVLCNVMQGHEFISEAKVALYEKHAYDLRYLKEYVRKNYDRAIYNKLFRRNYEGKKAVSNYASYIGMDRQHGFSKCSRDDFYAFLKKTLNTDDEYILGEIAKASFLPKQISSINGNIPYQVHLAELKQILKNANKYFSFLGDEQDGTTVSDKIISLLTFRIPYYVGPLNTASSFSWVVKNSGFEKTKITPWNFDKVIDKDASEEAFITNMTVKCTYLIGEDVLPESSLLYSEYAFLNELNNFKINGEKNEQARRLIFDYAKQHKKITQKGVLKLLQRNGIVDSAETTEIFSGIDGDFKRSLSSYIDFRNILGDFVDCHSEICEKIILWITLISDKDRLASRIKREYGKYISGEQIKKIKSLNYSKWGRFSQKLLTEIKCPECVDENGECLSIIDAMRLKNENLMQLLSNDYGYKKAIDEYNSDLACDSTVTYKTIEKQYTSPSVKRAIWRAIVLVKEIQKIKGYAPKKIFVETARDVNDNGKKGKRTISRKQQIIDLYKSINCDQREEWIKEIEETPEMKFNSDKLVLYYRQKGKSMYSGKTIRIEDVFNTNICDIDHIYPQSKIKDDSFDNRVLTLKSENALKLDRYPISQEIRNSMKSFWLELKTEKLISEEKYYRLTRPTPLTTNELADFINRQLVETRQSTKLICELLKQMLPKTEIVYAKAGNADKFKADNEIVKVRELNDLHHAKDAFINIVVGNVYNTKFEHSALAYFKKNNIESYNLNYLFNKDIEGCWKVSDKKRIVETAKKNTCFVTRMTSEYDGQLYNATVQPAGESEVLVPLKANGPISDTKKYGGYDTTSTAYFTLVESEGKKGKKLLSLERVSVYLAKSKGFNNEKFIEYCKDKYNLVNPKLIIPKIKIGTLFNVDGSYATIRGCQDTRVIWSIASQLFIDDENLKYLKNISNYFKDKKKYNKPDMEIGERYNISEEKNIILFDAIIKKLQTKLYFGLSLNSTIDFLVNSREQFCLLSKKGQCTIIMEILHFTLCRPTGGNFELLNGAKTAGRVIFSKFIQDKQVKMYCCSPTGYYNQVVDFNKFL